MRALRRSHAPGAARRGARVAALLAVAVAAQSIVVAVPASAGGCTYSDGKLLGTPGPDRCAGTAGSDKIYGYASGDRLRGKGGRDVVRGHAGGDRLSGGAGADRILDGGHPGDHDVVCAGAGRDVIDVQDGDGADEVYAQFGEDQISWDPGDRVEDDRCAF